MRIAQWKSNECQPANTRYGFAARDLRRSLRKMHNRTTLHLACIALAFSLTSCDPRKIMMGPGMSDFEAPACGGYSIWRTSAHEISVVPKDGWNASTPIIPTKVIECDFDNRFVIAKRQGLKRRSPNDPNDTYEEPDSSVFDFWILDTSLPKVFGPLSGSEFNRLRLEMKVPTTLRLKDVYHFRPS